MKDIPAEIHDTLSRAERLEWWSIGFLISIIAVMYFVMGSSQAMKTAWIEDTLSLIPPIVFLISRKVETMAPSRAYPFGFHRAGSLGFFLSAAALAGMGAFLIYDSIHSLILREHPTIGNVEVLGFDVWLGWLMIAGLAYSVVPPVILGRKKLPLAKKSMDKILHTDAQMNAADWKTGLAAIVGIVGIGFGFWWADAAAAGFIAIDILRDGLRSMRISVAELLDGAPRQLDSADVHPLVDRVVDNLGPDHPGMAVKLRETGRFVRASIEDDPGRTLTLEKAEAIGAEEDAWRLIAVNRALKDPDRERNQS
ncbi:cation transporter [Paracoccus sp. TK19116]|uniref:Cation transporter n=1 Tax=Paracoccus albicereus TaxID=2922394 RepID=A0ABT1MN55_9RHOB|nr:cation transporter [Paracoccus albicereus]MCQ0969596.1 cation transporter [Paracoccus albicereus]